MGNNGEGSCHGDAGGPVMCVDDDNQPILAGLQRKRSTCGGPFLVTKVNGKDITATNKRTVRE